MIFIKTISFLTFLLDMFIYISHDNIFDEEIYSFSRLSQDESSCIDYEEHFRVGWYIDYLPEITNLVVGVLIRGS